MSCHVSRFPYYVIVIFILLLFGGCRTAGSLSPNDRDYPYEDPQPIYPVRIHGKASSSLEAKFIAYWSSDGDRGCTFTVGFSARMPVYILEPVVITRNGEDYTATIMQDRYRVGRCGWRLRGVQATLSKNGISSATNTFISTSSARSPFYPKTEKILDPYSQDSPVFWLCKTFARPNAKPYFSCHNNWRNETKIEYTGLTFSTREVEANFIDIDE